MQDTLAIHHKSENFPKFIVELGKLFSQLVLCIRIVVPLENINLVNCYRDG
jgi:hypothetical protein